MFIFSTDFPLAFSSVDSTAQFFLTGNVFMPYDYLNFSPLYFPQLVNIFLELRSDPTVPAEASLTLNKVEGLLQVPYHATWYCI